MGRICKKCGYERQPLDLAPDYECPQCSVVYAKYEAHLRKQEDEKEALAKRSLKKIEREGRNALLMEQRKLSGQSVCTVCGHIGKPRRRTRGTIWIEIVLWLMLFVPGLVYSLWRQTNKYLVCPVCGRESMIPTTTPRGNELVANKH